MSKDTRTLSKVVQIDDRRIQDHLGEVVRGTVEETLNAILDTEADALCGALRCERSPEWVDTRAGSYDRKLHTKAGEVNLKIPKLRKQTFETAIIERNRLIEGEHPYVYLDDIVLKRSSAGEVKNVSVLVAVGVGSDGYRQILGVQKGHKEDKSGWSGFLAHFKQRGLKGVPGHL